MRLCSTVVEYSAFSICRLENRTRVVDSLKQAVTNDWPRPCFFIVCSKVRRYQALGIPWRVFAVDVIQGEIFLLLQYPKPSRVELV